MEDNYDNNNNLHYLTKRDIVKYFDGRSVMKIIKIMFFDFTRECK
jgi:hypothetical protein